MNTEYFWGKEIKVLKDFWELLRDFKLVTDPSSIAEWWMESNLTFIRIE